MLDDARQPGSIPRPWPKTLGGDKGYDTRECVRAMRNRGVTPHVAQRTRSAIDGRTTRHRGYRMSQKIRKRVEEIIRVDEDCGRISADPVSGSGAHRIVRILRGHGLTTWCGWPTCCRHRRPGPFSRCDPSEEHCAPHGLTEPQSPHRPPPESSARVPSPSSISRKRRHCPLNQLPRNRQLHSSAACYGRRSSICIRSRHSRRSIPDSLRSDSAFSWCPATSARTTETASADMKWPLSR